MNLKKHMTSRHKPSGRGKGKWQSQATFIAYKRKRHDLNNIAEESRKANRT